MAGRRGPHRLRRLLGQPDREAPGQGRRRLCPRRRRRGDRAGPGSAPARRPTSSPSALAAPWSRSRWPGWRRRSAPSEVNSRDPDRQPGRLRRHARLVGLRPRRPSRRARGPSRGARLYRQRRAAAAVRGDARQRPHLVVAWSTIICSTSRRRRRDLLYWFEDGARIPAAFLKSYNRELLLDNRLKHPAGFEVGGVPIDLAAIQTPMLVIALKDDHVSAWQAVYGGARLAGRRLHPRRLRPQCRGHQPAGGQQARFLDQRSQARERRRVAGEAPPATKAAGGRPGRNGWARKGSGKTVAARAITDGIEPAPGSYAKMP